MSVEDLSESLRQQDIFSFDDVKFAIVETNGTLSVMKKPEKENPTMEDFKFKTEDNGIEAVVISDGSLLKFSMQLCGIDEEFISKALKKENINQKDVFIMTVNRNKKYNIIKKK